MLTLEPYVRLAFAWYARKVLVRYPGYIIVACVLVTVLLGWFLWQPLRGIFIFLRRRLLFPARVERHRNRQAVHTGGNTQFARKEDFGRTMATGGGPLQPCVRASVASVNNSTLKSSYAANFQVCVRNLHTAKRLFQRRVLQAACTASRFAASVRHARFGRFGENSKPWMNSFINRTTNTST